MTTWQESLKNCTKTIDGLLATVGLNKAELPYKLSENNKFILKATDSFINKINHNDPYDPILLQILPLQDEENIAPELSYDPLNEQQFNKIPGLIHKYKTRVLLTITGACGIHCRYCFRRNFDYQSNTISNQRLDMIVEYIKNNPDINEVILSGGDPLSAPNKVIKNVLGKIRELNQIKFIRFHTRMPVILPERIDDELIDLLLGSRAGGSAQPGEANPAIIFVFHINHPKEIDDHFHNLIRPLYDNGITLLNQSVLLNNINNKPEILADLSYKLFKFNILPYYLHFPDKVQGTKHFFVDSEKALDIYQQVQGMLPGYLVPKFVHEVPGLNSKQIFVN